MGFVILPKTKKGTAEEYIKEGKERFVILQEKK
jgi:hypothetical protein